MKVDNPETKNTHAFCSWDLDLDLMTLVYKSDLDIPKM